MEMVRPGTVMILVAATTLTLLAVDVAVIVHGAREYLELQKLCAAGKGAMIEATMPMTPEHCAAERLNAMLPKRT